MNDSAEIRIVIADDHPVVRDGLAAILSTQADFVVVGEAADADSTLAQVARLQPRVLLLDLEMPGMDGLVALQQIRAAHPDTNILIFTAFDSDERIIKAVQSGVNGYLLKGAPREELFNAIRVVSQGGSLLHPLVASRLIDRFRHDSPAEEALTEREMDVLRLMARGMPNKEIAAALVVTERTVKFHISSILGKLGVTNRTEAVTHAVQRGLISLDQ
ncbi:MAG: response regulator transcription factor [Anaerolineae bacterium]|nr:response regulator transcription factor [Anaerolineae bacterium]